MLDNHPQLKSIIITLISPKRNPRPRLWIKWFVNPFVHKRGKGSVIRSRRSRIDVFPWRRFDVGAYTTISGFNHGYKDATQNSKYQALDKRAVVIEEDSHIGANSVVLAGVHIGKRCQIGAGSVVTKDIPDYSIAVGNPAKVIKRYDFEKKEWVSISKNK